MVPRKAQQKILFTWASCCSHSTQLSHDQNIYMQQLYNTEAVQNSQLSHIPYQIPFQGTKGKTVTSILVTKPSINKLKKGVLGCISLTWKYIPASHINLKCNSFFTEKNEMHFLSQTSNLKRPLLFLTAFSACATGRQTLTTVSTSCIKINNIIPLSPLMDDQNGIKARGIYL